MHGVAGLLDREARAREGIVDGRVERTDRCLHRFARLGGGVGHGFKTGLAGLGQRIDLAAAGLGGGAGFGFGFAGAGVEAGQQGFGFGQLAAQLVVHPGHQLAQGFGLAAGDRDSAGENRACRDGFGHRCRQPIVGAVERAGHAGDGAAVAGHWCFHRGHARGGGGQLLFQPGEGFGAVLQPLGGLGSARISNGGTGGVHSPGIAQLHGGQQRHAHWPGQRGQHQQQRLQLGRNGNRAGGGAPGGDDGSGPGQTGDDRKDPGPAARFRRSQKITHGKAQTGKGAAVQAGSPFSPNYPQDSDRVISPRLNHAGPSAHNRGGCGRCRAGADGRSSDRGPPSSRSTARSSRPHARWRTAR